MSVPIARFGLIALFLGMLALLSAQVDSQEVGPAPRVAAQPLAAPPEPAPEVPKGVEVMARGPIHEAFASPTQEAKPTQPVPRKPPANIEEMPPEDRPDGDVVWIGGYWSYDDERQDFLWVSGCWRVKPENREWVPGYWREIGTNWQWVSGFWANAVPAVAGGAAKVQDVTYFPDPPAPPNIAPPGEPPSADNFYVPGYYQWAGNRYIWRAGYWSRIRAGYVYVPSHYRWTPSGYVFIPGYWDYAVARRGVIYAPVVIDSALVPASFVYTPVYAVSDQVMLDAMFVRPAYGHYYFGDYYGPAYMNQGYVTTVVYGRTYYEPFVVYQRWEYRDNPRWQAAQINIVFERNAGRMPVPPRTLVQQQTMIVNNTTNNYFTSNTTTVNNTVINRGPSLAPAKTLMAAKGIPTTTMSTVQRAQVQQTAQAVQMAAVTQRAQTERTPTPAGPSARPRTAALSLPTTPVAPKTPSAFTGSQAGVPVAPKFGPNTLGHAPALHNPPPVGTPGVGVKSNVPQNPPFHPGPVYPGTTTQPKYTPVPSTIKGPTGTVPPHPGLTVPPHPGPAVTPFNPVRPPPPAKKGEERKKDR